MIPVKPEKRDKAQAVVFAKDQPQYIPLPANLKNDYVETKWQLNWRERVAVLLHGNFYLTIKTFGSPLQPIRPSVERQQDGWF